MRFGFSREPVAYITLFLAILAVVKSVLMHEPITDAVLGPVIIAISGVIARQKVTPVAKLKDESPYEGV